ncbi:MAG: efflux RND transporter periplasmic adaptor subunit, partial [Pseudomonadota bacterium]
MKQFLHLILAAAIVGSAWVYQFGFPDTLFASEVAQGETGQPARSERGEGGGRNRNSAATTVVATPLSVAPYMDVVHAVGTASAINSGTVITEVSGRVTASYLTPNADVVTGDVLIELDARAEEIDVEIAALSLAEAKRTLARYDSLHADGSSVITEVTLAEAQTAADLAEAGLRQAQAALADQAIVAPISGRLGLSDISVGDVLSAGDVIVHIEDTAAIVVSFELPERAIPLLAAEGTILASTPSLPGRIFDGVIKAHDNRLDETTRSVTVEANIANTDGILWPGMSFAVRLEHVSEPLNVVPGTAL